MAWEHEERSEAVRLVDPYCRGLEETRDGTGSYAPSPALHGVELTRKRIGDRRVVRLVGLFLKAGVLTEDQFLRTDAGTPQGGIISPLLANIALSAIEERYERWTYHRKKTQARRKSDGVAAAASPGQRSHSRTLYISPRAVR